MPLIFRKENSLKAGKTAVESVLVIGLIGVLGTKAEELSRKLGKKKKKVKLDFRRKSVPEISIWNLSIYDINNLINVGVFECIAKRETKRWSRKQEKLEKVSGDRLEPLVSHCLEFWKEEEEPAITLRKKYIKTKRVLNYMFIVALFK